MYFDARVARQAQLRLSEKVVKEDCFSDVKKVGGLDVSYASNKLFGVAVLSTFDYGNGELLEIKYSASEVPIPYVPTLLAFREVPLYYPLLRDSDVDVVLVDGHGIAHPRGFGVASHVGVVTGLPTIGVAKRKLYGRRNECEFGECLYDDEGEAIAVILKKGKRELYVSIGHCISLAKAVEITKRFLKRSLPEPIRVSDSVSRRLVRSWFGNPWLPKR